MVPIRIWVIIKQHLFFYDFKAESALICAQEMLVNNVSNPPATSIIICKIFSSYFMFFFVND